MKKKSLDKSVLKSDERLKTQIFISVIIPVHNGSQFLGRCLDAVNQSSYESYEVIVVDDASIDDSPKIARKKGAEVFSLSHNSGPAAARNYGAEKAKGNIVLFIDSDVLVKKETITKVATYFQESPNTTAVFGSYDDSPTAQNFMSQFRNLFHHFIHQNSNEEANTFWAGCGAIRRDVFQEIGGFDEQMYPEPSIEDIELGYRLKRRGYTIMLDKGLQVKHLKYWNWSSWLRTDIFKRAIPWSRLILESNFLPSDLNLRTSHRISAVLVIFLIFIPLLALLDFFSYIDVAPAGMLLNIFLLLTAFLLVLNRKVYSFFLHKKGTKFMLISIPLHLLYYLYSSISFTICWILHKFASFQSGLKK